MSKEYVGGVGLDSFMGKEVGRELYKYKLVFQGIVVQREGATELSLIPPGDRVVLSKPGRDYCRWHSGSLFAKDNPLDRKYCVKESLGRLGFCSDHAESLRGLYNACFSSEGLESIRKCWVLDNKIGDQLEYAVYLLAYSGDGFKVGSTRSWRLFERIAEQPHVVATLLYVSRSAYETRSVETRAGKIAGLTERPRRSLYETLSTPLHNTVYRLTNIRDRVRRVLKLNYVGDDIVFRIEPGLSLDYYVKSREVGVSELYDRELEVIDYYDGYLLVSDMYSNNYYVFKANDILHRDALKTKS